MESGKEDAVASKSASASSSAPTEISKKVKEKMRHANPRTLKNILDSCKDQDENGKADVLLVNYFELVEAFRKEQHNLLLSERLTVTLQREKNQLLQNNSDFEQGPMEDACRLLRHQNKLLQEENIAKANEDAACIKALRNELQVNLDKATVMLNQCCEENNKIVEENSKMRKFVSDLYKEKEKEEEQLRIVWEKAKLETDAACSEAIETIMKTEKDIAALKDQRKAMIAEHYDTTTIINRRNLEAEERTIKYEALRAELLVHLEKDKSFENVKRCFAEKVEQFLKDVHNTNNQLNVMRKVASNWEEQFDKQTIIIDCQVIQIETLETEIKQAKTLYSQLQSENSNYLEILARKGIDPDFKTEIDESLLLGEIDKKRIKDAVQMSANISLQNEISSKIEQKNDSGQQESLINEEMHLLEDIFDTEAEEYCNELEQVEIRNLVQEIISKIEEEPAVDLVKGEEKYKEIVAETQFETEIKDDTSVLRADSGEAKDEKEIPNTGEDQTPTTFVEAPLEQIDTKFSKMVIQEIDADATIDTAPTMEIN